MHIRDYTDNDHDALVRVWTECGWLEDASDNAQLTHFMQDARAKVAIVDGGPEACAVVHDGTMLHTNTDLPLAAVTAVTTSRVGRKQGLARAALRPLLVEAAERGMAVSVLGMFEQGFYDTVGFGTGSEWLSHRIDPADLDPSLPYRRPERLDAEDDAAAMAACLMTRQRAHGAVSLPSPGMRRAEAAWADGGFGLGYRDADDRLTHFIWFGSKGEYGPYRVAMWGWQDTSQLRELLGMIRSLGDQVRTVSIPEPAQVQLQVLTRNPGRSEISRTDGEHAFQFRASAWWQARMLDVPACVAAMSTIAPVRCNIELTDPLADGPDGWHGVAGSWVLDLDTTSSAIRGRDDALPTLRCSVNTFTRLWLGVRSPRVLAASDEMQLPATLLDALEHAIRLPRPDVALDF
ncbi:MAG: hypothetical protein ACI970_001486 [Myxococcota bacterium]|jgi:hypothetical protein